MKVLCFGGSTSSGSINRKLAVFASNRIEGVKITNLDLRDFSIPMFSEDEERINGIPDDVRKFIAFVSSSDFIVVSVAEHNGALTAAFKNLIDWASRLDRKFWSDKPMLLMSTSPGKRAGVSALSFAENMFPKMGASLKATFLLPSFYQNFKDDNGISDHSILTKLDQAIESLLAPS